MTIIGRYFALAAACLAVYSTGAEFPKERPAKKPPELAAPAAVDAAQFFLAPKREKLLIGGRFEGSNVSPTAGFQPLAEIKVEAPVQRWAWVPFKNTVPYRWVRFRSPHELHPNDVQLVFWSNSRKLGGPRFQDAAEGHFIGVDLLDQASTRRVTLSAHPGKVLTLRKEVELACRTPGATIRYTLDGTTPGPNDGTVYGGPIHVSGLTTISAVAFKDGLAPSPLAEATYFVDAKPVTLNTFHVGNSLTGNAVRFRDFAETAGIENHASWFLIGGAYTVKLWKAREGADNERFTAEYAKTQFPLAHFTLQPRDFNIDEEVEYERKFIDFVREKSPNVQPWLYAEWVERDRRRPSDRGQVPSFQMKKTFPAATWEESMSAMLLYVEEVQHCLNAQSKDGQSKDGKPARILPCSLALGWARNLIDNNQFPGVSPGEDSFYRTFFEDQVHVNPNGCYLVDAVWYAAFTGQSPEGKLLPVGTMLTASQARVIQQLAWQIVENYPDCGLFKEGTTPASAPTFSVAPGPLSKPTPVHLSSATPGVSYRYTLDGTTPTRTRGYVYCGTITAQPGMTIKAVAFKSGLADSGVVQAAY